MDAWHRHKQKWDKSKPLFILGNGPAINTIELETLVKAANNNKIYLFVVNGFFDLFTNIRDGSNIYHFYNDPAIVNLINCPTFALDACFNDTYTDISTFCATAQDMESLLQDVRSIQFSAKLPNITLSPSIFIRANLYKCFKYQILPIFQFLPLWKLPLNSLRKLLIQYAPLHPLLANPLGPSIIYSCIIAGIFLGSENIYIVGNADSLSYYDYISSPSGWLRKYQYFGQKRASYFRRDDSYECFLADIHTTILIEKYLRRRASTRIRYLADAHHHFFLTEPSITGSVLGDINQIIQ